MILQTSNLIITTFTTNDAPFIIKLVNTDGWQKFIGDPKAYDIESAKAFIQRALIDSYDKNGFGLYKVSLKDSGKTIGMCGLVNRDTLDLPDLGFAILPEYERQGYTHEASLEMLRHAKEDQGMKKLLAITNPANEASIQLLKKLGFAEEGEQINNEERLLVFGREL